MTTSDTLRGSAIKTLSKAERDYLAKGLKQPGGKLPLFDGRGQEISREIIKSCIKKGLAERWFANPIKPDWLVCRITDAGRDAAGLS
ncbi:MAG: hypothetical protein ACSHXY_01730 [Alphaproteobacteria bacterium]